MSALSAIKKSMKQSGLTQTDLAKLIGSRSRASEILAGKRPINMRVAWLLYDRWFIPAGELLRPQRKRRAREKACK